MQTESIDLIAFNSMQFGWLNETILIILFILQYIVTLCFVVKEKKREKENQTQTIFEHKKWVCKHVWCKDNEKCASCLFWQGYNKNMWK